MDSPGFRTKGKVVEIETRRVYEKTPFAPRDLPVLVDRLWPRGVSKESLEPVRWMQDWAPSADLRKWFHQHPDGFETFRRRYIGELDGRRASLVTDLASLTLPSGKSPSRLVLLYGSRDTEHNHAVILKTYLDALSPELPRPIP
jgi:uncharacterized protein YeaO (DUF488 family)